MADETFNVAEQNIEQHIVNLFERLDAMRKDGQCQVPGQSAGVPAQIEIRTLEFWRAVISECMASFLYVFIVCGAAAGAGVGASTSSVLLATALASGFAITTLTQCFAHISGAHVNPAVSVAMAAARLASPLRCALYVAAQCGGGIAGAALLYGVSVPGYQGNMSLAVVASSAIPAWERLAVELVLTFAVVFAHFACRERRALGAAPLSLGAAYSACSFVSMPYLNPARSLGPSFVLNKWENQWVYWIGPMAGGIASGLLYEFVFSQRRRTKGSLDGDSSSVHSDEDAYDDLDKQRQQPKFHGSTYNTYRPAGGVNANTGGGYCPSLTTTSLYSAAPGKIERVESLYGGTKSLYCRSPPLTRANLNRSQSVYTKSNGAINRAGEVIPQPGPLVPAQSLYPMRTPPHHHHTLNQNAHNQLQAGGGSLTVAQPQYLPASLNPQTQVYGAAQRQTPTGNASPNVETTTFQDIPEKFQRRPESVYGMVVSQPRRGPAHSTQSDDSSYGSYAGAGVVSGTCAGAQTGGGRGGAQFAGFRGTAGGARTGAPDHQQATQQCQPQY